MNDLTVIKNRLKQQFVITEVTGWTFVASFLWLIENDVIQPISKPFAWGVLFYLLVATILLHRVLIRFIGINKLFVIESFVYLFFVFFFVHLTGGLDSFFWFLYFIPIMISLVVLDSRNCFLMLAGAIFFTLAETVPAYNRDEYGSISLALLQIFGLVSFTSFGFFLNRWVIQEKIEKDNALFEHKRELKLSQSIIELAGFTLRGKSFELVLNKIVEQAQQVLNLKKCGLWIKGEILGKTEYSSVYGYSENEFHRICGKLWERQKDLGLSSSEIERTSDWKINWIKNVDDLNLQPDTSVVMASWHVSQQTEWTGLFIAEDLKEIQHFEKRFFSSVVQMISLNIQNQRVIFDLNSALKERSSKIADLLVLYEITKRMSANLELDPTIKSIIEMAIGSLNASICMIVLIDHDRRLFLAGIQGVVSSYADEEMLNMPQGLFKKIIDGGHALTPPDIDSELLEKTYQSLTTRYHMKSFLGCPLISQDEVKGVLVIFSGEIREYSPSENQLLETLAAHAVIAIKNATTYELLQSKKRELEKSQINLEKINTELIQQQKQLLDTTEELEKANTELIRSDEIKNEFVATVSHELRTPLTSIKESVVLVLDELMGPLNEDQKKFLMITKVNVERLARLINDLLDLSKLDAGKLLLNKEKVEFDQIVKIVSDSYKHMMKEKGINFTQNLPSEPVWVYADSDRLNQVLYNLINNAHKFTHSKGNISISLQKANLPNLIDLIKKGELYDKEFEGLVIYKQFAVLSVEDDGIEIQKKDLKKIFEKFAQSRLGEKSHEGTGLGLPIVKNILTMHHGSIWVDVSQSKHKSFKVCLPLYDEVIVQHQFIKNVVRKAEKLESFVLLILFEFGDRSVSVDQFEETLNDLNNIENLVHNVACEKEKDVIRVSMRNILVVIYGGDQGIALVQTEAVHKAIENSEQMSWSEKMHFVLSDLPMSDLFEDELLHKLTEMNVYGE